MIIIKKVTYAFFYLGFFFVVFHGDPAPKYWYMLIGATFVIQIFLFDCTGQPIPLENMRPFCIYEVIGTIANIIIVKSKRGSSAVLNDTTHNFQEGERFKLSFWGKLVLLNPTK
ncbi:MAG: hypothetical protein Q7U36_02880 [bacterium]|nr:hypothetical protein [bacterium]